LILSIFPFDSTTKRVFIFRYIDLYLYMNFI
jgi:hypothetical protein